MWTNESIEYSSYRERRHVMNCVVADTSKAKLISLAAPMTEWLRALIFHYRT